MEELTIIALALPLKLGTVNCYLVKTGAGFVLIDTGSSNGRAELERQLARAGCKPGDLKLIVLTHGDFDHTGNAAYLRARFGAPVAMHPDDAGMAERGDMFWNRSSANALMRWMAPLLFRFPAASRFTPDVLLADGDGLGGYGFEATILSIPGHSKGSIGVLAAGGLFCGDLLENSKEPATNSIMDDPVACEASLARLQGLGIVTVYPGHGRSFPLEALQTRFDGTSAEAQKGGPV
jgi:glyoxylase-like metal-dependent hydrolase (beta-lactamase superfamily II)